MTTVVLIRHCEREPTLHTRTETSMNRARPHPRRRALVVAGAVLATAGTLVAYAAASSPNQGNRLEATYTTSVAVLNNQLATYGIVQAIATGSGTLEDSARRP
jgi:ferric-dicitrate binding protein FerR (iron transport regulator)